MRTKIPALSALCLVASLSACQSGLRFINHPSPELPADLEVFDEAAGCPLNEYGTRLCGGDSPLMKFGCAWISEPPEFTGGLDPAYPLATCHVRDNQMNAETSVEIENGLYLYETVGILHAYIRLVIYKDGEFAVIRTAEEFREMYAPITTPEEALSYVLALTQYSAYYGLKYEDNYEYLVERIEDAHVNRTWNGYRLHLFDYELFGCGEHWTSAVVVDVSRQGVIEEIERESSGILSWRVRVWIREVM